MNIILIGFMGTGKSTVGRRLAREMSMDYLDADELIEKTEKLPISAIFAQHGESRFRDLETKVIETLQDYDNFVISTGGGMVIRPENVRMLKEIGPLVWLRAEPGVIYQRVKHEKHRPLLEVADPKAAIKKLLDQRTPLYEEIADLTVDTSKKTVGEAVLEIMEWVRSR